MFKMIGLLLLAPLFIVAFVLRLAVFVPLAVLFLFPVILMRPRLILRAPRMFRHLLLAKRRGGAACGPGGRLRQSNLEMVGEPLKS